jgi:outer membrane receptor for ferrienterochelin and colicins
MRALRAVLWLGTAGLGSGVSAQDGDAELDELLEALSEETELATRTRMNSDFVPGIVTVLDAQKLQALGVRTVWDALAFVPGVEAWRDPSGTPTMTVRGIPFPFNSGSVQVLIDGVPIAAEAAGINGAALFMPVELVERLEFVRGPGSVIYGDYAFQGLLNIITRDSGSRLDLVHGSRDRRAGSARVAGEVGGLHYALQAAGLTTDEASLSVRRGAREDRRFYTAHLQAGEVGLRVNAVGRDLDGRPPQPANFDEGSAGAELRWERAWSAALGTRLRAQRLENDLVAGSFAFRGGHRELGAELTWVGHRTTWLAGIEYNDAKILSAQQRPVAPPGRPPPPVIVFGEASRNAKSAYVQGQFALAERWQATLGARYDDNELVGARLTPRASLVWRVHDHHILKAQIAEGFRSPTFFEVYTVPTQPRLDYEVNRTAEINYVYQQGQTTARATLFSSRIDDMVFRNPSGPGFANVAMADSDGVELEFNRQLGADWRIDAALAWVDSHHDRNATLSEVEIGAAADWFGNLGVLWTPNADDSIGLRWTHVGPRASAPAGDDRYDRIDLSWTRRNLWLPGLDLQLALQNASDDAHVYLNPQPNGDTPVRYEERVGVGADRLRVVRLGPAQAPA